MFGRLIYLHGTEKVLHMPRIEHDASPSERWPD